MSFSQLDLNVERELKSRLGKKKAAPPGSPDQLREPILEATLIYLILGGALVKRRQNDIQWQRLNLKKLEWEIKK